MLIAEIHVMLNLRLYFTQLFVLIMSLPGYSFSLLYQGHPSRAHVSSRFEGSATIISCKGKTYFLTNAHLLLDSRFAIVQLESGESVHVNKIADNALQDWALLEPVRNVISKLNSVEICQVDSKILKQVKNLYEQKSLPPMDIFSYSNGQWIPNRLKKYSSVIRDEYISDFNHQILFLNTFARPGFSGSPVFLGNIWMGILTKIDSSGSAGAFVQSSVLLAEEVKKYLVNKNADKTKSFFLTKENQIYLVVKHREQWLAQLAFYGANISSGGGDPGNGGESSTSAPIYFVSDSQDGFTALFQKANPLSYRSGSLLICKDPSLNECKKTSALKIDGQLKSATIARYQSGRVTGEFEFAPKPVEVFEFCFGQRFVKNKNNMIWDIVKSHKCPTKDEKSLQNIVEENLKAMAPGHSVMKTIVIPDEADLNKMHKVILQLDIEDFIEINFSESEIKK